MLDKIKEAKENGYGIVFEKYQIPKTTWEDMMNYIYRESLIENFDLVKKAKQVNNHEVLDFIGNIQIQSRFWLAPQNRNLFEEIEGVSELLYKLNNGVDNKDCSYYKKRNHDCSSEWHPQGIRMSLSNRVVSDHHDPHDVFYWQIVGTSFWKINKDITYTLEPGDLLYLPKECSHEVWCDGPRAGLLVDNLN